MWNQRRLLQQRCGGEEGGQEIGDIKELLAKAHTPRGEDAMDKSKTSIKFGAQLSPGMPFVRR